jgi:hypothetical protein
VIAAEVEPAARLDQDIVCFLYQPAWRLELRRDGRASCTDRCPGPRGLRATVAASMMGEGWAITLDEPAGPQFLSLTVRRTNQCKDPAGRTAPYEISARRGHAEPYEGCCLPLAPAPPG